MLKVKTEKIVIQYFLHEFFVSFIEVVLRYYSIHKGLDIYKYGARQIITEKRGGTKPGNSRHSPRGPRGEYEGHGRDVSL